MKTKQEKEKHALEARMSRIRKKVREGTATQLQKAELSSYESDRKQSPKPPVQATETAETAPSAESTESAPESKPVEVQSTLPGTEGGFSPPPLDLSGVAAAPAGNPSPPGTPAPSASFPSAPNAAPGAKPNAAPAMSKEEAEAQGGMVADLATQILMEFNAFNLAHKRSGVDPQGKLAKMFHFSVKRLATKYGAGIDEDQYDAVVIIGSAGFVGYNSFLVYRDQQRKPAHLEVVKNDTETGPAPSAPGEANGAKPPTTVFNGGAKDRFGNRAKFDPDGYY